MYGRPDLYGSSYIYDGMDPNRFKRLTQSIGEELFGPDELDEVELEEEFGLDDDYGRMSLSSVPALITSKISSWTESDPVMAPGTPPSARRPAPVQGHPAAVKVANALAGHAPRPPQVQGTKVYAQLDGPTWPHALQAAATAANASGMALRVTISDTNLPMRGTIPLALEVVPMRTFGSSYGFFTDHDAQQRAFESIQIIGKRIAKSAEQMRRLRGSGSMTESMLDDWESIMDMISGDLQQRKLPPNGSGAEYLERWKGTSPSGVFSAIRYYALQMASAARKNRIDGVVASAYPLAWLLYIASPRSDVWDG